ncbi:MAG: PaaI family thioesterase [Acidimicrobiia bacterium]
MNDAAADTEPTAPNAARFAPLEDAELLARWSKFPQGWDRTYFPNLVGLELEEVRTDYARLRLRFRPELEQPAGVVHGGAIATLIDTVVVPAVGQAYDAGTAFFTVQMDVRYLGSVVGQDAIAEGWIEKRGRSIVFCRAEVRVPSGQLVADGTLTYTVR